MLLLEAASDIVSAVGEVEWRAKEVAFEEAKEVGLVRVTEKGNSARAFDGEDGEVGCGVDVGREDAGNLGALRDDDEVVG